MCSVECSVYHIRRVWSRQILILNNVIRRWRGEGVAYHRASAPVNGGNHRECAGCWQMLKCVLFLVATGYNNEKDGAGHYIFR